MLPRALKRLRSAGRHGAGEEGLTMIEVVIAALVLTLGSLALFNLMSTQARNTFRGEQSQVVSNRLQEEMEKIKSLPYSQIALTGLPTDTADTADPRWRTIGTNYAVAKDGSQHRALVYNGSTLVGGGTVTGGTVSPAPEQFSSGDTSGTIYRFVTWEDDPNCPATSCPGSQDLKRVTVAIRLDTTAAGGRRTYQELQSQVVDPEAKSDGPSGGCTSNCGGSGTPWTFFLTDTPSGCSFTDRQPINGDHLVHNTNGACSSGLKNSSDCTTILFVTSCPPGTPDLMVTHAPPLTTEQPLWDYATDVEPTTNADQDKGLQVAKPGSNGCLSSLFQVLTNVTGALIGDPSPTRMQQIHKWVSNPMGNGINVILDGRGELNLWTKSVNGATYTGSICIWLFERHLNLLGVPVDTPAVNLDLSNLTYFTYTPPGGVWPQNWTELHIPLHFNLGVNLGPASRLGLALQVERSGTSGGGLEFMYDEPSFDSRLEVTTTGLLPF
jgi:Tfp pilus assembly protein PilV